MSIWKVLEEDAVFARRSSVTTSSRRLTIVKARTNLQFNKYQHLFQMSSPLETKSQFDSDEVTLPVITNGTVVDGPNNIGTRRRIQRTKWKSQSYIGHGVVIGLVNMLCAAYGKSPEHTLRLSKHLCESLVLMKVLSPNFMHINYENAVPRTFQRQMMTLIHGLQFDETDTGSVVPFRNDWQQTHCVQIFHCIETTLRKVCQEQEISNIPLDPLMSHWSRLGSDFEEIKEIGVGGFSTVVQAKNKLDGRVYAIKKIVVPVSEGVAIRKGIDEIRILANLTHPNIVSYKCAWVSSVNSELARDEDLAEDAFLSNGDSSDSEEETSRKCDKVNGAVSCSARPTFNRSFSNNSTFWASRKYNTKESKSDESDYGAVVPRHNLTKLPFIDDQEEIAKLEVCIMMDLCNCTLQEWFEKHEMRKRLPSDQLKIFRQILEGISFIHENGIIHRDLKPENIFIECETLSVKIGDFGLACAHCRGTNLGATKFTTRQHTQGIGTLGYISPEQKNGNKYDHKSDMYSIGVIASELYLFYSKTEQAKAIESFHRGDDVFFEEHTQKFPREVDVIRKLLSKDPQSRPEACYLLKHDPLFRAEIAEDLYSPRNESSYVASLEKELQCKDAIIMEKDEEILALKSKIENLLRGEANAIAFVHGD